MSPKDNIAPVTGVLFENDEIGQVQTTSHLGNDETTHVSEFKRSIIWINVLAISYVHFVGIYGLYLSITSAKLATTLFAIVMYWVGQIGITAGTHRLFSHRSYKATWQLRLLLMLMDLSAYQGSIYHWARDHRVHHKYSETNADPHNAKRGIFFSHVGWLLLRKHPDTAEKGKGLDVSDLWEDPIVRFQHRHYWKLMPWMCIVLPTVIPVYFWQETWSNAYYVAGGLRYMLILHSTWLINSAAHLYGNKPYDRTMNPSENKFVSIMATGEGWHNYHHTFSWDYKAAELGDYKYNFATAFIDFFAKIGWAYDLKTVSKDIVKKRVERSGDGTHSVWGCDDKGCQKSEMK